MKDQFLRHKKKIIIGAISILSYFFAPAAMVVPLLDRLIEPDTIELVHDENIKEAKELLNVKK